MSEVLKIGGNRVKYWFGKKLNRIGDSFVSKGKYKIVTNPSCRLINPFTLIINFTVDTTDKYQLILEGNYKSHYKESEDSIPSIKESELFSLIREGHGRWFKKE